MDLLGKARRLESNIARRLDRAARKFVGSGTREPLEVIHLVVEAVDREIQSSGRGRRLFPFDRIALSVLAPSRDGRARYSAVFAAEPALRDRIVGHLQSKGCQVDGLTVDVAYVARAPKDWGHSQFNLEFTREERPKAGDGGGARGSARIEVMILRGTAERKHYAFSTGRIDLGRGAEVRDSRNRLIRTNHVAFVEGSGEVNDSVSRRHAHIDFESMSRTYRVRDDGSVHGTCVVRNGRTVAVPRGSHGVRLCTGDEVVLGEARLRIKVDDRVETPRASPAGTSSGSGGRQA